MRPSSLYLQAVGTYLPPNRLSPGDITDRDWYGDESPERSVSGIGIAEGAAPIDLALDAARQAFTRAGRRPAEIDLLIHSALLWQGSEEFSVVGYLLRQLGAGYTDGLEIQQGCNGLLSSIYVAAGLLALRPRGGTALLTTSLNATSPCIDRWRSAGPGIVLGDGGAAVLLDTGRGFARVEAVNSLMDPELEGIHRGDRSLHEPAEPVRPQFDVLSRMQEFLAGSERGLPEIGASLSKIVSTVMQETMSEAGLEADQLSRIAFTNVEPGMIETLVMNPLGLPLSRATWDYGRTIGHVGACDQFLSLDHLLTTGQLAVGDHVMLIGGSAGYCVSAVIITILEIPQWATAVRPEDRADGV
ncbi:ketoacyl-ACP synthase III family protein [Actinoplanes sp. NPDC004185]